MAKEVQKIKLQVEGGNATPGQKIGPVLGQAGINIGEFVSRFNQETQDRKGEIVPVVLTVYEDRKFDFVLKTAPASDLLRKAAGVEKGSGSNLLKKAGSVTKQQIKEIAEKKLTDLNASDTEAASKIIEGTARSMGIEVK